MNNLKEKVKNFSSKPGVYLMKSKDEVIYVGKAKNLRKRLQSYFSGQDDRHQIKFLLNRVDNIEVIITISEDEAFVLERDLITKFKPRYNIRLKDDKSYLSIMIDNSSYPYPKLVRKRYNKDAFYYGPYTSSYQAREMLDIINQILPLRSCSDSVFKNRMKPCIEYQIKRCSAPCCLKIDETKYTKWVDQAHKILAGNVKDIISEMKNSMKSASENLNFEYASLLRDRVKLLEDFSNSKRLVSKAGDDIDIVSFYREEKFASISFLLFRDGRVADSINYTFNNVEVDDEEFLSEVLEQYYRKDTSIANELLLPFKIEDEDFIIKEAYKKYEMKVSFIVPKIGLKYRLLKLAELNAKENFITKFEKTEINIQIAKKMTKLFSLSQVPRRVECLDISNLQSSDIVGAIVSFFDGEKDKSNYKKYKIKQKKQNDFAAIYEVVYRRLEKGIANQDLPDLLVIDGGKAQLNSAIKARNDLNVTLDIISVAKERSESKTSSKKEERVFYDLSKDSIILTDLNLKHFITKIRDEVHRFVITFHRSQRSKRYFSSELDKIPGVGAKRKVELINKFGSVEIIKNLEVEDIIKETNISINLAKIIYNYFN